MHTELKRSLKEWKKKNISNCENENFSSFTRGNGKERKNWVKGEAH
jgi:hypothetical protein